MINAVIYLDKETFKIQLVFGYVSRKKAHAELCI